MKLGKSAIVIGAGIGGLGSACLLAKAGWAVTVVEKNEQPGGRVGLIETGGFKFDSGPSWFLMKDVYEHFFELLGEDLNQHLRLQKLTPSYRVFYKGSGKQVDIYSESKKAAAVFEELEPGGGRQLRQYLDQAAGQYRVAKDRFMYKNYDSARDFLTPEMLVDGQKLNVLSNMHSQIIKQFKNSEARKLLEFPALFVGTAPSRTPALYGVLNHALFDGVYYPAGGMYEIVKALVKIAEDCGVKFRLNSPLSKIIVKNGRASGVEMANGKRQMANLVISNADMHHTETKLLEPKYRTKSAQYWQKRTLAPSALLIYLGLKGKLPSLAHHNLLFCEDWRRNFKEIFDGKLCPADPSFYVCCPSKTDVSVAPKGHENLFVLVPIPSGFKYTAGELETFADKILATMESEMNVPDLRQKIVYKQLFAVKDFAERYNSYQGSALGLSHTLRQTAAFRPNNVNKKVKGLYYVGAGTNPGIGIPPALISAELMYKRIIGDKTSGPLSPE